MKDNIKKYLLFTLLAVTAIGANAQSNVPEGKITGKIIDQVSKEPVGFASVALFSAKDSSLVSGATAADNGDFLLDKLAYGNYYLKISLIGFTTKKLPNLILSANNPSINLGTISVASGAKKLSEVEIIAQKNIVEYGLDKQIINVAKDISSTGGTASDALKNAPSVSVDIDGNVSVRGSSNVSVLIDGKNSGQTAQTILSQTPASAIEKIEVITNPSAKYDAEGMGGIINIILKKEKKPGLNGNAALNLGTFDNHNASINLNYRYRKFNFFGGYDIIKNYRPSIYALDRTTVFTDTITKISKSTFLEQRQSGRRLAYTQIPKIGFDYQLSDKQLITLSLKSFRNGQNEKETVYNFLHFDTSDPDIYYTRFGSVDNDIIATDLTFNYTKAFANKRQELTASAVYSQIDGSFDRHYNQYNTNSDLSYSGKDLRENFLQRFTVNPFFAQADYVHPVGEKGKIESGAKHSQRILKTDFQAENFDFQTNQFVTISEASNKYGFDEYVSAAYTNYANAWKKISYQVGLRAEQTNINITNKASDSVVAMNYLNLFPSAFLSYEIDENRKVQLNYSRRINRPNYEALNPFKNPADPLNIWFGNPELKPELIDSYEASYLKFWNTGSLTNTVFYRSVHNLIQQVRYVDSENALIAYNTYVNLNDATSYGLEISGSQSLAKWWKLSGNVSGFNYKVSGNALGVEAGSSKFSWLTRLNSNFNLPENLSVQVSVNYRSPQALAQGTRAAIYNTDISLKKDLLNKKASITLRVSDVFNTLKWDTFVSGEDLIYDLHTKRQTRIAILGFAYRFGVDQEKRKRNEAGSSLDGMF